MKCLVRELATKANPLPREDCLFLGLECIYKAKKEFLNWLKIFEAGMKGRTIEVPEVPDQTFRHFTVRKIQELAFLNDIKYVYFKGLAILEANGHRPMPQMLV